MDDLTAEHKKLGSLVGACLLNNIIFTTIGVGIGCAVGLQYKKARPIVYGIMFGTMGDMVYGYTYTCADLIRDLKKCEKALALEKERVKKE